MTLSVSPLIANQLIDCIATGREPTENDLSAQAERIWIDGAAGRSIFSWTLLPTDEGERSLALRAARLALIGSV